MRLETSNLDLGFTYADTYVFLRCVYSTGTNRDAVRIRTRTHLLICIPNTLAKYVNGRIN